MEKNHSDIVNQIFDALAKWWVWILYVGIGIIGKIGMYLRGDKKETIWQHIGSVFLACFGGFLATVWCMGHYPAPTGGYSLEGAIIVPTATLLSDRLTVILWNANWVAIIELLTGKKIKDKN